MSRTYIRDLIRLCGRSDSGTFLRTFQIRGILDRGEGATCICYNAWHKDSGQGVLKEFYPDNGEAYAAKRNSDGQLIIPPVIQHELQDGTKRFREAEESFLESYEALLKIKQREESRDLSVFIPEFEIYHGCDENGNIIGTSYIWTPNSALKTFEQICDEIHDDPSDQPESKLATVLKAIQILTNCICELHQADMLHRDIKPSNFGFRTLRNKVLTETLTMFDIGSLCPVCGAAGEVCGTPGFREPEAEHKSANCQSDIYSIGATLFYAVVVTEENKEGGFIFRSEYYKRIREMVRDSDLIRASEHNSHPKLVNCLVTILEKCLGRRTARYERCEDLLEDIKAAVHYVLPSEFWEKQRAGETWALADAKKALARKEKSSFRAIQYHLYRYPLYRCSPDTDENLNVLIVGFGKYGQKFMDTCLQNGQIRNKKLNVAVISDDPEDQEMYLKERPQLKQFFVVRGKAENINSPYGSIAFEVQKLEGTDNGKDAEILLELFAKHYGNQKPQYIFIALGNDRLNYSEAQACEKQAESINTACSISYVCENKTAGKEEKKSVPVYVNMDLQKTELYPEIERMALNTHLVWDKDLNVSASSVKTRFRDAYNYDSCISNVLSMKYKLYSIGIDMDKMCFAEAARRVDDILRSRNKDGKEKRNQLIWIEHRRWVTEKLCLGWRKMELSDECAGGLTKDQKGKRHICIVKSDCNQNLKQCWSLRKWDTASNEELKELDELDRLSVELHRLYRKRMEEVKKHNLLAGRNIASIRELIRDNKKAIVAFQEWFTCLKDIWNGDRERVFLYEGLKDAFLAALTEERTGDGRKQTDAVKEQIRVFETQFDPVRLSMEYRDWKQIDTAMIDNIPFILTYTDRAYFVIPFATGNNTEVFGNVASATMADPEKIIYLYHVENSRRLTELKTAIPYVMNYIKRKELKAAVEFVLLYTAENVPVTGEQMESTESEIRRLGNGRIRQIKLIPVCEESTIEVLKDYLAQRSIGKRLFAAEKNGTHLSGILEGAGFYRNFPSFRFDSKKVQFESVQNCGMLQYINKRPFITVADMAAFKQSSSESSNQPEFFADYKDLWNKYRENSMAWKVLCGILREYSENSDILAVFKQTEKQPEIRYQYRLPIVCYESAVKIVDFLKKEKILEPESRVNSMTTDSCEVVIAEKYGNRNKFDGLFSQVYALMDTDKIDVISNKATGEKTVCFDNLVVNNVKLANLAGNNVKYRNWAKNNVIHLKKLMEFFRDKGYVINLCHNADTDSFSFVYATVKIKELLTMEGKMLEVYTYHKVKELGQFDDVVSSYEINWGNTDVKNEFDCILTKGFRALFVECKARKKIEQEFYFKIDELAGKFGINATAVLIADTEEAANSTFCDENAIQRERGNHLNVVTVWKKSEIGDIGQTLLRIINETYHNQ